MLVKRKIFNNALAAIVRVLDMLSPTIRIVVKNAVLTFLLAEIL